MPTRKVIIAVLVGYIIGLLVGMWIFTNEAEAAPVEHGISRDHAGGTVTWIGSFGSGEAAAHYGDRQPTYPKGTVLRVSSKRRSVVVRVTDVCAGSSCRMLDLSDEDFRSLFGSTARGVGRVEVECGRAGKKPIRRCLAGEDK